MQKTAMMNRSLSKNHSCLYVSFGGLGSKTGELNNCAGLAIMNVDIEQDSNSTDENGLSNGSKSANGTDKSGGNPRLSLIEEARVHHGAMMKRVEIRKQKRAAENPKDDDFETLDDFDEDSFDALLESIEGPNFKIGNSNTKSKSTKTSSKNVDKAGDHDLQDEDLNIDDLLNDTDICDTKKTKSAVTIKTKPDQENSHNGVEDELLTNEIQEDTNNLFTTNTDNYDIVTSGNQNATHTVVAVTDSYNKRVQFWTTEGVLLNGEIGLKKLRGPGGITAVPSRKQWIVTDCESASKPCRVIRYDQHGHYLSQFHPTGMHNPSIITSTPNGEYLAIIEVYQPKICIFTYSGKLISEIIPTLTDSNDKYKDFTVFDDSPKDFIEPEYCVFDANNNLYVSFGAAASVIKVYSLEGILLRSFGEFTCAAGIFVSENQNILVADRETQIVSVYNVHGQELNPKLLSPGVGLRLYPHALMGLDGSSLILTLAQDVYSVPSIVQIFSP